MPFASAQAKECLNFQISLFIYSLVALVLCLLLVGFLLLLALLVAYIVLTINAAMKVFPISTPTSFV